MMYEPLVQDNLFAFVMLVMALLFPIQFDRFPVQRISWPRVGVDQLKELETFHAVYEQSVVWGKWWSYAEGSDYEGLKSIGEIVVWRAPASRRESGTKLFFLGEHGR